MPKFFYQKLAFNNLKNNFQTYRAYILTSISTISMYFVMHAISVNKALDEISGGGQLKTLLFLGVIVVAIFSAIFLLYTNSFLIKRRKKELGLFNILGMEKRHLAKIMFWETFFVALASLTVGIVSGMILSKLMFLILLKLISFSVPLDFEISLSSIYTSFALYGSIFAISLLYNLGQVQLTKPIELLRGNQMGEREPKTRWLLVVIGLISLGSGYYVALTIKSPLQALIWFFGAVLLVMIGTYSLFTAGSVGILKLLRRNKNFYYQPRHFTAVSGLLFRMKQNAVGLANICILSTAVLITLSTTFSLYVGVEEQLRTRFPQEITMTIYDQNPKELDDVQNRIFSILDEYNTKPLDFTNRLDLTITTLQQDDTFLVDPAYLSDFSPEFTFLIFLTANDYVKLTGNPLTLEPSEVLVASKNGYPYETLTVLERTFQVKGTLPKNLAAAGYLYLENYMYNYHFVVVRDLDILQDLNRAQALVYGESASKIAHFLGFDLRSNEQEQIKIYKDLRQELAEFSPVVESRAEAKASFYTLYGGLFFVGLFLGTLFLLGTVLIIYYKQITEGYDDQRRFKIMQQVGMSQEEVKKTIRSQVLMVFYLPLITAGIHVVFAFNMITRLLVVFNLTNVHLFAWCCLGIFVVFALLYGLVYSLTARVYYKIVSV